MMVVITVNNHYNYHCNYYYMPYHHNLLSIFHINQVLFPVPYTYYVI